MIRLNPHLALEASRAAFLFALRRDWAPYPQTQPWQAQTQRDLILIAQQLQAEAMAALGLHRGDA